MPIHRLAVREYLRGGPGLAPDDLTTVFLMREDDDTAPRPLPTLTVGEVPEAMESLRAVAIRSVKVFAGSRVRDISASQSASPTGLMARTIRAAKEAAPNVAVMTETCVCSHTESGECWLPRIGRPEADLDATIDVLASQAVMQADAGADIVGPAAMIPGSVRAVRQALDASGHADVAIMPHLIFESGLYEGYRSTMRAAPRSGARVFQVNPRHPEVAVHIAQQMVAEGADMLLTEPALHTVDTLVALKQKVTVPIVPFSVSGEYLRLTDLRENGERDVKGLMEAYTVLKRSGAHRIVTYGAVEIAQVLRSS